jgi:transposase
MRLSVSKSKNATSLYVIKSTWENNKRSSKVVEKLGTLSELKKKLGDQDPFEWAKKYIAELNEAEKQETLDCIVKYSPATLLEKGEQRSFNGGYLFLDRIYHELQIHKLCKEISEKYKFEFDLDSILSRLIFARALFPASKRKTLEISGDFIEPPNFELQHIYRALEVISKESDFIQTQVYKNSVSVVKRNTSILYYDCTNFFFEIEQEDELRRYGVSKENRPNPIVQMGLFMDGDGIPLAFDIHSGNTNEQTTLKPLEEKIIRDFECSRLVVCTDAGLSSMENRKFNDCKNRAFITTQSIKKLKKELRNWALDPHGWSLEGEKKKFDISLIDEDEHSESTFYKEQWIKGKDLEQKLIVTFSLKYRNYQRSIRNRQIERAEKLISTNPKKLTKHRDTDYKRLIQKVDVTKDGEIAEKALYSMNTELIKEEELFDGFYAVCTNLEDSAADIARVNRRRWEIEECFRIMKSEFKARPVYLSREDRIKAHFITCFLALTLYRILEKRLDNKFTCNEIIQSLQTMNFYKVLGEGYVPVYTRTDFTDTLHEAFGFRTDYQIVTNRQMKKILKKVKS